MDVFVSVFGLTPMLLQIYSCRYTILKVPIGHKEDLTVLYHALFHINVIEA